MSASTQPVIQPETLVLTAEDFDVPLGEGFDPNSPKAVAHFEQIWAGKALGFGEVRLRESLAEDQETLRRLLDPADRGVTPVHVIGTGYKPGAAKGLAVKWLEDQIEATSKALSTRGRTHAVNVSNARYRLRKKS